MNNLSTYIIEKLKINKDIKINDKVFEGNPTELANKIMFVNGYSVNDKESEEIFTKWIEDNHILSISFYIEKKYFKWLEDNEIDKNIRDSYIVDDEETSKLESFVGRDAKWLKNNRNAYDRIRATNNIMIISNPDITTIVKAVDVDYKKIYGSLG